MASPADRAQLLDNIDQNLKNGLRSALNVFERISETLLM